MQFINSLAQQERLASIMEAIAGVAKSGHYTEGAATFRLESLMSALVHGQPAVSFNSRGSALYATYDFYARQGHKAIAVQNNAFVAVGAMAIQAGLDVYLVDSAPDDPAMGIDSLRKVLTDHPHVKLVALQHVGGWRAQDFFKITDLCEEKKATLVEDCSSILGLDDPDFHPGLGADASIWSFQQTCSVPVGGGGVVTTLNLELRNHIKQFRSYGKRLNGPQVVYGEGLDLRMSEWEAAIACVQIKSIPEIKVARKRDYAALELITPCLLKGNNAYQCYPVETEFAAGRKTVPSCYTLNEQMISTLPSKKVKQTNLQNSYAWSQEHRCLPLGEGLYDGMSSTEIMKALHK